jgi:hypothetical protein
MKIYFPIHTGLSERADRARCRDILIEIIMKERRQKNKL